MGIDGDRPPRRRVRRLIGMVLGTALCVVATTAASGTANAVCVAGATPTIDGCEPAVATLVIEKQVKGSWPVDGFTFQVRDSFGLLATVTINQQSPTSTNVFVPAGSSITVTEDAKPGYDPISATCTPRAAEPIPRAAETIAVANGETPTPAPDQATFTPAIGETWGCVFVNGERPTLDVRKLQLGGDQATFDFTLDRAGDVPDTAFSVKGDTRTVAGEPFTTELDLGPADNEFRVSELPASGFRLVDIYCYEESTWEDLFAYEIGEDGAGGSVTIGAGERKVRYGDDIICNFVNGRIPQLTVSKSVTGGAGDSTPFDFTVAPIKPTNDKPAPVAEVDPVAFSLADGGTNTVTLRERRDYELAELPVPEGYRFDEVSCMRTESGRRGKSESEYQEPAGIVYDGQTVRFPRVDFGTVIECTYTNVKLPRLTVVKALTNGSGAGLTTPFSFTITGQPAFTLTGGQSDGPRTLPVGVYTVTEGTLPAGFTFTSVACSEPSPVNGQSVEVNLAAGDDVTCTFSNDQTPPPVDVAQTPVLVPRLAIVKTGPLRARGLQRLTYAIRVRNRGNGVARNVVVTDVLPTGLSYVRASRKATVKGRTVSVAMGNLQPGASRTVKVTVRAAANIRGRRVNVAVARATGVRPVRDTARTVFTPLVRRVIPAVTG